MLGILENPFSPRYYREMIEYYNQKGMQHEAEAFKFLIGKKFDEKTKDYHNNEK